MVLSLMSLSLLFKLLQSCRCAHRIVLIIMFASLRNCCGLKQNLLLLLLGVGLSRWWSSHLGRIEMVAIRRLLIKQVIAVQVKIRWETLYSPIPTNSITICIRSSSIGCWDKSSWNWHHRSISRQLMLVIVAPSSCFGCSSLARLLSVGAAAHGIMLCEEIAC